MPLLHRLINLPPALLLCAWLYSSLVSAKVPIDVELQATFPTPPLLVELLYAPQLLSACIGPSADPFAQRDRCC